MIAETIRLTLSNVPLIMLVAAIAAAFFSKRPQSAPQGYLAWLLLLSVGVDGVWAGFFHIFFPEIASAQIGWRSSPFEFEIGVADLALGIAAIAAFRRSLSFKSGIALYAIIFYLGVTIGHVHQAFAHGDFSPDNFGLLLVVTVLRAILLSWLLWACWRDHEAA